MKKHRRRQEVWPRTGLTLPESVEPSYIIPGATISSDEPDHAWAIFCAEWPKLDRDPRLPYDPRWSEQDFLTPRGLSRRERQVFIMTAFGVSIPHQSRWLRVRISRVSMIRRSLAQKLGPYWKHQFTWLDRSRRSPIPSPRQIERWVLRTLRQVLRASPGGVLTITRSQPARAKTP